MYDQMTLTLFNRDEMAAWVGFDRAHLPGDPGSDVLLVDAPDGTMVVVLGQTIERTETGQFRKVVRMTDDEITAIPAGACVQAVESGHNGDGSPITRRSRITVDRSPWFAGRSVVLSDGRAVTAVVPGSIRILD